MPGRHSRKDAVTQYKMTTNMFAVPGGFRAADSYLVDGAAPEAFWDAALFPSFHHRGGEV